MKVIIVGGVAGGASCAARLRRLDEKAEILMVERGPYVSYANCGLPYHVGGTIEKESSLLVATERTFRTQFAIDCRTRCEVVGISAKKKTVDLKNHATGEVTTARSSSSAAPPSAPTTRRASFCRTGSRPGTSPEACCRGRCLGRSEPRGGRGMARMSLGVRQRYAEGLEWFGRTCKRHPHAPHLRKGEGDSQDIPTEEGTMGDIISKGHPGNKSMTGEKSVASCTFCGQPITGESPEQPNPCEYCSSLSGGYPHLVNLTEAIAGSAVGYAEGATYPQILLSIARSLLARNDDKLCGLATIVAHLACEVAIERSLSDSIARQGIKTFADAVANILDGYNLANDKVRNLYTSVTGDEIREQPFWSSFIRSAKRRDNIIRKGLIAGRTDAEESTKTASDFLAHLVE